MKANAFRHFYNYRFTENRKILDSYITHCPMNCSRNMWTIRMGLFEIKSFISRAQMLFAKPFADSEDENLIL